MKYTLPFEYDDATTYGMRVVTGIITYDGRQMHLEYQTKDAIVGVMKGEVNDLHIQLDQIQEVSTKKGWFSRKFIVKVKSLRVLEGMPGVQANLLSVKVSKSDFGSAQNIASAINLDLSELRLNQLKGDE